MSRIWLFVRLARPHFLIGGALLYAAGAAQAGVDDAGAYWLGQALVTTVQLTAQFVNEFADVEADEGVTNRTFFSGGSGILSDGLLSPRVALVAAWITTGASVAVLVLVLQVSVAAAFVGVVALTVSWAYSLPPIRLLNTGWGEVAATIVVAVLVPFAGSLANGGKVDAALLWLTAIFFLVHMTMLLAFELPDIDSDQAAGKRVLAVRLGRLRTMRAMGGLLVVAASIGTIGSVLGAISGGWLLAVVAIPATGIILAARRNRYSLLTTAAVATMATAAIVAIVAA